MGQVPQRSLERYELEFKNFANSDAEQCAIDIAEAIRARYSGFSGALTNLVKAGQVDNIQLLSDIPIYVRRLADKYLTNKSDRRQSVARSPGRHLPIPKKPGQAHRQSQSPALAPPPAAPFPHSGSNNQPDSSGSPSFAAIGSNSPVSKLYCPGRSRRAMEWARPKGSSPKKTAKWSKEPSCYLESTS